MTDDRKPLKGPFDFEALFGAGRADAARAETIGEEDFDAAERCRRMALEVQGELPVAAFNILRPCRGEQEFPACDMLDLPRLRPRVYVFWGAALCDCIEGDDTEIMTILVYNPYRNVTLGRFEINRITVVDSGGNPVPTLPDGSPSIQLVPRGTYCFGDIAPCWFAYRQFVLRLRGAPPGTYRILIEGICFEVCFHQMTRECVEFDVCQD